MRVLIGLLVLTGLLLVTVPAEAACITTFEWTEGSNSSHFSIHGSGGPVLADDFTPALTGQVCSVEWWGSPTNAVNWEITFHPDANGAPQTGMGSGDIIQQLFLPAPGSDPDGDGIFHYSAPWPSSLVLTAGQDYWFSVANDPTSRPPGTAVTGWTWAIPVAGGPTVGSEQYCAVVSNTAPGNPHHGPWTRLPCTDFAFRINIVPEPSALVLVGAGLGGLLILVRRRRT
jgi:hypothetical protein